MRASSLKSGLDLDPGVRRDEREKWTSVFAVRFRDGDGEVGGAWAIARNRCDPLLSRYGDR